MKGCPRGYKITTKYHSKQYPIQEPLCNEYIYLLKGEKENRVKVKGQVKGK
jgi:hypothetical protein